MAAEPDLTDTSPLRVRARFRSRTLLITVAIIAVAVVVIVLVGTNNHLRTKLGHRIAVGRIFNSGSAIWFQDKSQSTGIENPYTAQTLNLWRNVGMLDIKNDAQAAIVARELARIPEVGSIEFGRGVTDTGLVAVLDSGNCNAIEAISFFNCSISNNGLSKLAQVPKLRVIMFNTCPINSAGLAELKKLSGLQSLRFVEEPPARNTNRLSDACFSEIKELTQIESLSFGAVNISDLAAQQLHNLKQLKKLSFHQGFISDAAVAELRAKLPNTKIEVY